MARVGVVVFPGSCDERTPASRRAVEGLRPSILWHGDGDLRGVDAVVIPGGFSYGDYLRAGAIARFSPVMEAVAGSRATAGPVLGICNGFQVLCEAGLLPGALLAERVAAVRLPPGRRRGRERRTRPSRAPASRASGSRCPSSTRRALLRSAGRCSTSSRRTARCVLRYAPGREPERLAARHRRRRQRGQATCSA